MTICGDGRRVGLRSIVRGKRRPFFMDLCMESSVLLTEQAGVGLIGSEADDLTRPLLKKTDRGGLGDRGFCGRSVVVKPPLDFLCTSCQQDRVM